MERQNVPPWELDILLAEGWRHFGTFFFQDRMGWNNDKLSSIIPLRINLKDFRLSKSQKKILRKNKDTRIVIRDAFIDEQKETLFYKHCARFKQNVPQSIYDFVSHHPSYLPCHTLECCLYDAQDTLYAVSFFDVGQVSTSSVYAMFDPDYSRMSPGLHTLLLEILYALQNNKKYLYTGYAFQENSHYDYKKKFTGTECYDWQGNWYALQNFLLY